MQDLSSAWKKTATFLIIVTDNSATVCNTDEYTSAAFISYMRKCIRGAALIYVTVSITKSVAILFRTL